MRWPMLGFLFAIFCVFYIAITVHGWYHTENLRLSRSDDPEENLFFLSFFAGFIGAFLSFLDFMFVPVLQYVMSIRVGYALAAMGLVLNFLLLPLAFYLAEWVSRENARWAAAGHYLYPY